MKFFLFFLLASIAKSANIMPWMCLERCNDSSSNILYQLNQFQTNTSILNMVAFEDYNLGPNSTLIKNNLTQVAKPLASLDIETYAMISSYPYPPEFLTWMRAVFNDPFPFIEACWKAADEENLTGFNIDWEPTEGNGAPTPTEEDAVNYANFLNTFSRAMHMKGLKANVDVATWTPIWNYTLIGKTAVDGIFTMATYTDNDTSFLHQMNKIIQAVPIEKIYIGLETTRDSDNQPYTDEQLEFRFNAIKQANIHNIGIWRASVPDNWWKYFSDLL